MSKPPVRHINPDHYLETASGRVFTAERNTAAWHQAYADLRTTLQAASSETTLYVVVGAQGAGKSTWIEANIATLGPNAVFFDAAMPAARHRERVIAMAQEFRIPAVAVWLNTPLDLALARNQKRTPDKLVPEEALRNVFSMMEPPTVSEGFAKVIEVTTSA